MRTRAFLQSSGDPVQGVSASARDNEPRRDGHRPVLLHEAVESLALQKNDIVLDATLGGAGHAREIVRMLGPTGVFIGMDADQEAIERSTQALPGAQATVHFIHANFRHVKAEFRKLNVERLTKALFDLGWSSYQLSAGRGFSFLSDEPLSMAYDAEQKLTAGVIVNQWEESSIADILFGFGEERYSRRIARAIVEARKERWIATARELADIVKSAVSAKYRHGRIHPATKTFQALRIAVNDELGALEEGLAGAWEILTPGGRIAVITFHSLEDRIVKRIFIAWEHSGEGVRITKKVVTPSKRELAENPRAHSAKLRVIEKVPT